MRYWNERQHRFDSKPEEPNALYLTNMTEVEGQVIANALKDAEERGYQRGRKAISDETLAHFRELLRYGAGL